MTTPTRPTLYVLRTYCACTHHRDVHAPECGARRADGGQCPCPGFRPQIERPGGRGAAAELPSPGAPARLPGASLAGGGGGGLRRPLSGGLAPPPPASPGGRCTCPYCTRMRGLVEHYRREVELADERQSRGAFG